MIGTRRVAALLAAGSMALLACGSQQANNSPNKTDPGITSNQILLGGIFPASGTASAYYSIPKAMTAYFDYVNKEKGGVNGRQIKFDVLDDAYSPANTPAKARQLAEEDKVFLDFGQLGTPTNLAVRDYWNSQSIPQLFVSTGSDHWGKDFGQFPWTLGWQLNYGSEARMYAAHILQNEPNDKIAILYQNDDYGTDYVNGLKAGLGGKADSMIVGTATYNAGDPTNMSSQVAKLKATGADTFYVVTTPAYAASAVVNAITSGWKPKLYMNAVANPTSVWKQVASQLGASASAFDGMISAVYLKDPLDSAKWGSDAGVKLFKDIMTKYGGDLASPACDATGADGFCVFGMAVAYTMVDVLKKAGNNLTRKNVMDIAAKGLKETDNPLTLPGIVIQTTPTDHFPIAQGQLEKWNKDHWEPFGAIISGRSS
ncbi:MAG: branched-chain amino acid ABC transporter substrate-binding protein [Chloroflexi bacterium]|nr:MAG: branched-chain amino acid ABC transporter substrate-binding protein [Chloroflexota bacterium]